MSATPRPQDTTRQTLTVLWIAGLIGISFVLLMPLLAPLLWAVIIVVATWPLRERARLALWGRDGLAAGLMTLVLVLVVVTPLTAAIWTIVSYSGTIASWAQSLGTTTLPAPPEWLAQIPVVGPKVAADWERMGAAGPEALGPYLSALAGWFVAQVGSFGLLVVNLIVTVLLAAFLFNKGESIGVYVVRFGRRLGGERGEQAVILARQSIRAVALGVVVTAVVQTAVAGFGLLICGVPFAALLIAIIFILTVVQLGPGPVLIPVVIWLYWQGDTGAGTVMLVVAVVVGTLDNFLRPMLIQRGGADLPILLIFAGVIGGLIEFGIVGLFVGPAVLAVSYTLLVAWIDEGRPEPAVAVGVDSPAS